MSIKPGAPKVTAPHGVIVGAIDAQIPPGYSQAPVWLEYIFGQRRVQTCALLQIPCIFCANRRTVDPFVLADESPGDILSGRIVITILNDEIVYET